VIYSYTVGDVVMKEGIMYILIGDIGGLGNM